MNAESLKEVVLELLMDKDLQKAFFNDVYAGKEAFESRGIEVTKVEQVGGEGEGRDYWTVWKFSKDSTELFIKFYGFYQSYYGSEYEGYSLVAPKQKMVTVYE